MAVVSLFWDSDMVDVTLSENALQDSRINLSLDSNSNCSVIETITVVTITTLTTTTTTKTTM